MSNAVSTQVAEGGQLATISPSTMEALVVGGDLRKLTAAQRLEVYRARCEAAGIDPRTQPFQYLELQGKLTLYATKTATDQIIAARALTVAITDRKIHADLGVIEATCRVTFPDGRSVEDVGVVALGAGAKGDTVANAIMKAVTKAKRRTVLSACGLGMLDETERETIPGARDVHVDAQGEIIDTTARTVSSSSTTTTTTQAETKAPSFTTDPNAPPEPLVTEAQVGKLKGEIARVGWAEKDTRDYILRQFNKLSLAELTQQQGKALHVFLKGLENAPDESTMPPEAKEQHGADAPPEKAEPKASKEQIAKISVMLKNVFGDFENDVAAKNTVKGHMKAHTGKESRSALTKAEASKYIEILMTMEAAQAEQAAQQAQPTPVEAELVPSEDGPQEGDAF